MKTPTTALRLKTYFALMPFKKKVKYILNQIKLSTYNDFDFEKDKQVLSQSIQQTQAWQEINQIIASEKIGCVFTTAPFLVSEDLVCRAAHQLQIPIYYSVLSFDNLTTRGYIPFTPKRISVWNKQNKIQVIRIWGESIANKIDLTGPPQFDFYFNKSYVLEENLWRTSKKMPNHRPIILYGANTKYFIPDEYKVVKLIDDAIEQEVIQGFPVMLVRPHPTDSFKDWELFVRSLKHTYIEKTIHKNESEVEINNKYSNFSPDDVRSLCSSLKHTAVHISYASTLALDGICFDKPQICPYFSPSPKILSNQLVRNLYHTEHYLPITESGAVMMPKNEQELISNINLALTNPQFNGQERYKIRVDYLNSPNGFSTDNLVNSFCNFLEELSKNNN